MSTEKINKKRSFTVELNSKKNLKTITVSNGSHEGVVVEGSLGKLKRAVFAEGIVLEIVGTNGVLRIDIIENEIWKKETSSGEKMKQ